MEEKPPLLLDPNWKEVDDNLGEVTKGFTVISPRSPPTAANSLELNERDQEKRSPTS